MLVLSMYEIGRGKSCASDWPGRPRLASTVYLGMQDRLLIIEFEYQLSFDENEQMGSLCTS